MAADQAAAVILVGNVSLILFIFKQLSENVQNVLTFSNLYSNFGLLFANFLSLGALNYALSITTSSQIELLYTAYVWWTVLFVAFVALQFLALILMSTKKSLSEFKFKQ